MEKMTPRDGRGHDVALAVVAFLGLYQGVVPLVVRLVLDRDQRFAPALWLPAPWWWIACLAITAVAVALVAAIGAARERRRPPGPSEPRAPVTAEPGDDTLRAGTGAYDAASAVVLLVGLYNGVAPFVVRLVLDRDGLLLALPLRLPAPWWWLTSLAVVLAAVLLLEVIDRARRRQQDDRG